MLEPPNEARPVFNNIKREALCRAMADDGKLVVLLDNLSTGFIWPYAGRPLHLVFI
jgi:hypothetical protein